MEDWSEGQSRRVELVTSRAAEGQGGLVRPRSQGEVGPGARLLAQALQLCLGLGMAKGPQCPGGPALGPAVLLFVARVQAAHVKGAEEAALRPSVVLQQGLQAGKLGRQVLRRKGLKLQLPFPHSSALGTPHPLTRDPALLQKGGNLTSERSPSCLWQSQTLSPLFLSRQPGRD